MREGGRGRGKGWGGGEKTYTNQPRQTFPTCQKIFKVSFLTGSAREERTTQLDPAIKEVAPRLTKSWLVATHLGPRFRTTAKSLLQEDIHRQSTNSDDDYDDDNDTKTQ